MARFELWVELDDRPGNLAALAGDLAACGANIVHLDVHPGSGDTVIDRLVVQVPDDRARLLSAVAARCGATLRTLGDVGAAGPDGTPLAGAAGAAARRHSRSPTGTAGGTRHPVGRPGPQHRRRRPAGADHPRTAGGPGRRWARPPASPERG